MKQQNLRVVITLMLILLCWVPGVWAEPYIAAYAGFSLLNDTDKLDASIRAVSIDLIGRYSLLKSPAFPRGRMQPYIGVGPGLFSTSIDDVSLDRASTPLSCSLRG
jgi:hypothetical protein